MLPSHLQSSFPGDPDYQPLGRTQRMPSKDSAAIPIGLTGVICDSRFADLPDRGRLHCTVFRPRHIRFKPPLICVPGGPLLPGTYLAPLVHLVTDRAIVLYDHCGCGQSTAIHKTSNDLVNVQKMAEDLSILINMLDCEEFHLFGHSFGGLIVYEYLQRQTASTKRCLSATLASTPCSLASCEYHCNELLQSIVDELGPDPVQSPQDVFRERHECRVQPLPLPLHQAFQMAGFASSRAGLKALLDEPVLSEAVVDDVPALILRGQYDLVTMDNCYEWSKRFPSSTVLTLAGCSHYGMLEQESLYGSVLSSFVQQHDPPAKPLFASR